MTALRFLLRLSRKSATQYALAGFNGAIALMLLRWLVMALIAGVAHRGMWVTVAFIVVNGLSAIVMASLARRFPHCAHCMCTQRDTDPPVMARRLTHSDVTRRLGDLSGRLAKKRR